MESGVESRSAVFTVWSSTEGLLAGLCRSASGQVGGQSRQFLQRWRGKGRGEGGEGEGSRGDRGQVGRLFRSKGESAIQRGDMKGSAVNAPAVLQMDKEGFGFPEGCQEFTPLETHIQSMGPGVDMASHITTGICKIHSIYISLDKKALILLCLSLQISQVELEFR